MSSLIHTLELIKYFTFSNSKITHHSPSAEFVDYEDVQIDTPEGLSFKIKHMRFNYFKPQENNIDNYIKVHWGNVVMQPDQTGLTMNGSQDKVYVFHSEQFLELSSDLQISEKANFSAKVSTGGFWGYIYSVVIQVEGGNSVTGFESFMNMQYGDTITTGTWKKGFSSSVTEAKTGNYSLLNLYDPRIFQYEMDIEDRLFFLENFEQSNIHPDVVLSLLKPKDKSEAWKIINLLKDVSKKMVFKLNRFFLTGLNPFLNGAEDTVKIEYIVKYNGALKELFDTQIEIIDLINIAIKEKEVYSQYGSSWNLYNKLAENANVFIYNPNYNSPTNLYLDFYSNELNEPCYAQNVRDAYFPFDTYPGQPSNEQNTKLAFSYRAFLNSPENMLICHKKVLFKQMDPLQLVKVYILDADKDYIKEIQKFDSYEKLLKIYTKPPKDADIKYVLMPAVCLVNLYTLNIFFHDSQLINFYKSLSIAYMSAYFTALAPIGSVGFYLGLADTFAVTGSTILQAPGVQESLHQYDVQHGTNYQSAINDSWAVIQGGIIAINLTAGTIWGVTTINNLFINYTTYRIALNQFKANFDMLTPELRANLKPLMQNGWKHLDNVVSDWEAYMQTVNNAFKPGWTVGKVLEDRANGIFHEPTIYLKQSYINTLFAKYQNGFSFLVVDESISTYLSSTQYTTIGRTDGTFVLSFEEMNMLLNATGRDIVKISNELGIPLRDAGSWISWVNKIRQGNKLLRIDVHFNQVSWKKLSVGNEGGANPLWLPGGVTPKNWAELVIESIPKSSLNSNQITIIPVK